MKLLVPLLLATVGLGVMALPAGRTESATPGQTVAPLLSCPNVDASPDNKVAVGDILAIVQAYFNDYPAADYYPLYDLVAPYSPGAPPNTSGKERVDDILAVVNRYFEICPPVDTQVAQASRWVLTQHPELLTENVSALLAAGYVGISTVDVPGQGVHYSNGALWDGNFNPAAPEGLVYKNGRLAAQLYVVNGYNVGWVPEDPGPNEGPCGDGIDNGSDGFTDAADPDCVVGPPVGTPPDDVNFDPYAYCGTGVACSWVGDEGWHLHYRLCIVHIGTPYAQFVALGSGSGQTDCDAAQNSGPHAGAGLHSYFERMGWMGHLWNWLPNANQVPDVDGTMNGRFADCFPDTQGWKAYNCPQ
jgi:hypothetical protein